MIELDCCLQEEEVEGGGLAGLQPGPMCSGYTAGGVHANNALNYNHRHDMIHLHKKIKIGLKFVQSELQGQFF